MIYRLSQKGEKFDLLFNQYFKNICRWNTFCFDSKNTDLCEIFELTGSINVKTSSSAMLPFAFIFDRGFVINFN